MKRPKKYTIELAPKLVGGGTSTVLKNMLEYYQPKDIDPLLDELERLKANKKPFPSFEEFENWFFGSVKSKQSIYNYFSQFQYEKTAYPKVGDMVAGKPLGLETYLRGKLEAFYIEASDKQCYYLGNIVPVTRPTREEVVAKYGITDDELEILRGDK